MPEKIEDDGSFINAVESLIDPVEVSDLIFFQTFKRLLPVPLFKRVLARACRKTPYMGFVIEPYSFFLFFRLKDLDRARAYLPARYELRKARMFEGDEPDYYLGMGMFNTRASAFWGTRHESYLIAEDRETGLLSWIFIDILSDTLIALPEKGVADPNCGRARFTTTSAGDIRVDIEEKRSGRRLKLRCDLSGGRTRVPDQELWVMGNTSIAHSVHIAGKREDPFAVIFDPSEVGSAIDVPPENIHIEANNLFPGLAEDKASVAACFPWAQHYIADSPGCRTAVKDPDDMVKWYKKIAARKDLKTFSTKGIRPLFYFSLAFFPLLSLVLSVALILVLASR